ncbi:mechanosensitive ion channel family protein [uncultured Litoreibacter sp.]|uniref:mechanosensitive ion channel family protein n=1 Tax=uncultured Litoreibacter sp. TaxID=1392394 RepID=UPI002620A522|nr:mechanosensitive ion channel family protein [uncultured Litoreibacter sp.]
MTRFLFALCAAFVLLLNPAFAQEQAAEADSADVEVTDPTASVSVEPVARDEEIEERILEILRATGWFTGAQVNATDGIVFLDGRAITEEHKIWARNLATNTQDVVAVVNRITVTQEVNWSFAPALKEIKNVTLRAATSLPLIIFAIVILPIAWWLSATVAGLMRRWLLGGMESPLLRDIFSRILALPIFLIGLYVVLQVAGLTQLAFSLLGGAGVLGIIVGFAFRDIAENFLASLLLSIRRPFRSGDYIDVGGMQGSVQSMNTRSTVLLSSEGNHIQIPNATIFKSTIVNYSASPIRRETIEVGVGYDASIARTQEIVMEMLDAHDAVIKEPHPMVLVDSLGASTVNIKSYFWIDARNYSVLKVKSAILRQVKRVLTEEGISMPDDAREVIFPQGVPVLQLAGAAEKKAKALADRDIRESAEESALAEPSVSDAESNLTNEQTELEVLTSEAEIPENDTDLLAEKS